MNDLERFFSKTRKRADGCIEWVAGCFDDGYPAFYCDGKTQRGNRWIFQRQRRKLRAGEQALHTCDFKRCVNVLHLYAGTHQDNMDDLVERGLARGIPKSEEWKRKARAVPPEVRRAAANVRWEKHHAR